MYRRWKTLNYLSIYSSRHPIIISIYRPYQFSNSIWTQTHSHALINHTRLHLPLQMSSSFSFSSSQPPYILVNDRLPFYRKYDEVWEADLLAHLEMFISNFRCQKLLICIHIINDHDPSPWYLKLISERPCLDSFFFFFFFFFLT